MVIGKSNSLFPKAIKTAQLYQITSIVMWPWHQLAFWSEDTAALATRKENLSQNRYRLTLINHQFKLRVVRRSYMIEET